MQYTLFIVLRFMEFSPVLWKGAQTGHYPQMLTFVRSGDLAGTEYRYRLKFRSGGWKMGEWHFGRLHSGTYVPVDTGYCAYHGHCAAGLSGSTT